MENDLFKYHSKNLDKYIKANFLRNTSSRTELLRFLCSSDLCLNSHFPAEEAFSEIESSGLKISRASVFRNLTLFADIGILKKSKFGENHFHYEVLGRSQASHHHLICKNCGKVIEFCSDNVNNLAKKIAVINDFSVLDYRFEIFGYCTGCKKEKNV